MKKLGPSRWARVRLAAGQARGDEWVDKGLRLLGTKPPAWSEAVDYYYWLHGSEALRVAGGAEYGAWRKGLLAALPPNQRPAAAGCEAGSWSACDPWASAGGRVYSTAAAVLALESCREDPAVRPVLAGTLKQAVVALDRAAAAAAEEEGRQPFRRAAMEIRAAHRP